MLQVNELTVAYPDKTVAVDRLSFALAAGDRVALIGANGAGKTSLLLSMMGVIKPSGGEIRVNGAVLNKETLNQVRRDMGLVFQNPDDQLFMPDVYSDVAFGPRNFSLPEEAVAKRVQNALETLGITHLAGKSAMKLSGGEKRSAAIAAVLAMEPRVLLMDEPTAFLDPGARKKLSELLLYLPQAMLIATHDLDFAARVCSRVVVLRGGKLFAQGGTELLYDQKRMDEAGIYDVAHADFT